LALVQKKLTRVFPVDADAALHACTLRLGTNLLVSFFSFPTFFMAMIPLSYFAFSVTVCSEAANRFIYWRGNERADKGG
jgi:hypothetical protein